MHSLLTRITNAQNIILSTHTQPDGDGLGSQVALYYALKKIGKDVRIINVEPAPKKYDFLNSKKIIENFKNLATPILKTDLSLVFDTNDPALLVDLWAELQSKANHVCFIDHHPILERYPISRVDNLINTDASSTGEIVFDMIKSLKIPFDAQIAMPLYTSIVFDTNYFRYIRGSPTPHLIAAELLRHGIDPQNVHKSLFGNYSQTKLKFLGQMLGNVEYEFGGKLAYIRVKTVDINKLGLEIDETRDIIDMVMNVEVIEAAVLLREDSPSQFKVSFRSKGLFSVDGLAQELGGGGHKFAAGAYVESSYEEIKSKILKGFEKLFTAHEKKAVSS
jgi:phosphoesterase RecJ-like protein